MTTIMRIKCVRKYPILYLAKLPVEFVFLFLVFNWSVMMNVALLKLTIDRKSEVRRNNYRLSSKGLVSIL